MAFALIGLGANLGNRRHTLDNAASRLLGHEAISAVALSTWHEMAPVGGPDGQPPFLNGALKCQTSLTPSELFAQLMQIEVEFGRQRQERWDARTLDLDLLLYDDQEIDTAELTLPHPRIVFRRFVLAPAVEVAAEWIHPANGFSLSQLLANIDRHPRHVALLEANSVMVEAAARTDVEMIAVDEDDMPFAARVALLEDALASLAGDTLLTNFCLDAARDDLWLSDANLESAALLQPTLVICGEKARFDRPAVPHFRLASEWSYERQVAEVAAALEAMR